MSNTATDALKDFRQEKYLRALATLPEVKLHFGRFSRNRTRMRVANPPPNTIEVIKQELRMRVGIINPHPLHKRTPHLHSDFARQIRVAALVSSQLPLQMKDAHGTFTKPSTW